MIKLGKEIGFGLYSRPKYKKPINKSGKGAYIFMAQSYWQMIAETGTSTREYCLYSRTNSKAKIKQEINGSNRSVSFKQPDIIGCKIELYPLNQAEYRIRTYVHNKGKLKERSVKLSSKMLMKSAEGMR